MGGRGEDGAEGEAGGRGRRMTGRDKRREETEGGAKEE